MSEYDEDAYDEIMETAEEDAEAGGASEVSPGDRQISQKEGEGMVVDEITGFSVAQAGTAGCEVRDPNGIVVAWMTDRAWASVIAGLLEVASYRGIHLPQAAPAEGVPGRE